MSIHSSLRSGGSDKKHRSVLKRFERLKMLKESSLWDEGKSVLGIPKVKMQKLKVKKEKAVAGAETPGAPAVAVAGAPVKAAPMSGGKTDKK